MICFNMNILKFTKYSWSKLGFANKFLIIFNIFYGVVIFLPLMYFFNWYSILPITSIPLKILMTFICVQQYYVVYFTQVLLFLNNITLLKLLRMFIFRVVIVAVFVLVEDRLFQFLRLKLSTFAIWALSFLSLISIVHDVLTIRSCDKVFQFDSAIKRLKIITLCIVSWFVLFYTFGFFIKNNTISNFLANIIVFFCDFWIIQTLLTKEEMKNLSI